MNVTGEMKGEIRRGGGQARVGGFVYEVETWRFREVVQPTSGHFRT